MTYQICESKTFLSLETQGHVWPQKWKKTQLELEGLFFYVPWFSVRLHGYPTLARGRVPHKGTTNQSAGTFAVSIHQYELSLTILF